MVSGEQMLLRKKNISATMAFFVLAGLLLTLLSPSERVLGANVKVVYLHGTFVLVGLLVFVVSGVAGFAHIITDRNQIFRLVKASRNTAIIFWIFGTIIGILAAYLTWGGVTLAEPRLVVAIFISVLSVGVYLLSSAIERAKITSLLSIVLAVLAVAMTVNAKRILHPDNPIRGSDYLIELYFYSINLMFLIVAVQMIRWMMEKNGDCADMQINEG